MLPSKDFVHPPGAGTTTRMALSHLLSASVLAYAGPSHNHPFAPLEATGTMHRDEQNWLLMQQFHAPLPPPPMDIRDILSSAILNVRLGQLLEEESGNADNGAEEEDAAEPAVDRTGSGNHGPHQ